MIRNLSFTLSLLIFLGGCDSAPDAETVNATGSTATATVKDKAIEVAVSYQGSAQTLPESSVVYVFVREVGKKMPLAVEKMLPSELPVQFGFAERKDQTRDLEVVARLSLSGNVYREAGDVEVVGSTVGRGSGHDVLRLNLPAIAGDPTSASGKVLLRVTVEVEAEVGRHIPELTPVFVAAREASGLPVVAKKLKYADLPRVVEFSDADSMFATNRLSHHQTVEVVARLALSGRPIAEPGDWQSAAVSVELVSQTDPVVAKIDRLVQSVD